uniref:hypothetical protein n=1 Tax=Lachnoclostridium phocaeense TaxID=1871021 RepID=UPI0026DD3625|nr:hypothetical protein [Lachnoclostridium phocaeense]
MTHEREDAAAVRFYLIYSNRRHPEEKYIFYKGHISLYGDFRADNGYTSLARLLPAYKQARMILNRTLYFGTANLYDLVVEMHNPAV